MLKKPSVSTPEKLFWNSPKTIAWFRNEQPPIYWQEFFQNVDRNTVKTVLDLGCGAGRNAEMLARLKFDIYGCDYYNGMVRETRLRLSEKFPKRGWQRRIIKASMLDLPYKNDSFDAIISNGVYHNVQNIAELDMAVRESARVLRQGGYLCFNLFSSRTIASELAPLRKRRNVYFTAEGLHLTLISEQEFLGLARKYHLILLGQVVEYERKVTTGLRSVMRGVLTKS